MAGILTLLAEILLAVINVFLIVFIVASTACLIGQLVDAWKESRNVNES